MSLFWVIELRKRRITVKSMDCVVIIFSFFIFLFPLWVFSFLFLSILSFLSGDLYSTWELLYLYSTWELLDLNQSKAIQQT